MDRDGKVKAVPAPWAAQCMDDSHFFATQIIDALVAKKVQSEVAELFRTTPNTLRSIME